MSAIQAEVVNYKLIQTRKVLQIVLEVPIEHANHVTSTLGWPQADTTLSVGVARIIETTEYPQG